MKEKQKSQTDWNRIDNMTDEEIDFSDIPPVTDEMFDRGFFYRGTEAFPTSNQTAVPIFNDVVEFFKKRRIHYTFEIDKVLRDYIAVEKARENEASG